MTTVGELRVGSYFIFSSAPNRVYEVCAHEGKRSYVREIARKDESDSALRMKKSSM